MGLLYFGLHSRGLGNSGCTLLFEALLFRFGFQRNNSDGNKYCDLNNWKMSDDEIGVLMSYFEV